MKLLYVASLRTGEVYVIDVPGRELVAVIPVGGRPYGVAAAADRIYVTDFGGTAVHVIDPALDQVFRRVEVAAAPGDVAVAGERVYVTNYHGHSVSVIERGEVVAVVAVGKNPAKLAVGADAVYVTNFESDDVSVLDPTTCRVIATIPVGTHPNGVVIAPDGRVYVSNSGRGERRVSVLEGFEVVGNLAVGEGCFGVALGNDRLYAANYYDNSVTVLDTVTGRCQGAVRVGVRPENVVAGGGEVFVANTGGPSVSVLDGVEVVATIDVPSVPGGLAYWAGSR
ncbi:YncE family protein [Kribbella catacumbae]|uniref:YncE family protein n=1 Tax=Kribbella catacumbae TaxID=460086 RepID=UPI00036F6A5E|nr:YncE family protein [Kribbella catacumbae]